MKQRTMNRVAKYRAEQNAKATAEKTAALNKPKPAPREIPMVAKKKSMPASSSKDMMNSPDMKNKRAEEARESSENARKAVSAMVDSMSNDAPEQAQKTASPSSSPAGDMPAGINKINAGNEEYKKALD